MSGLRAPAAATKRRGGALPPSMSSTPPIIALLAALATSGCSEPEGPAPVGTGDVIELQLAPFEPHPQTRTLTVAVERPDGRPAAGARVRFLDTRATDPVALDRAALGLPDADAMLGALGVLAEADERGAVGFPWSGGPVLVDARLGDAYAMEPFASPEGDLLPVRLELAAGLVVRVVDSDGAPRGDVPVRLVTLGPDGVPMDLAVRRSDPGTGELSFPDRRGGVRPGPGPSPRFAVGCALPGLEDGGLVTFDPAGPGGRPGAAPMLLEVPPVCRVVVECVDGRGRPIPVTGVCTVEGAQGAGPRIRVPLERGRCTVLAAPRAMVRARIEEPFATHDVRSGPEPTALEAGGEVVLRVSFPGPEDVASDQRSPR